jgi:hypothetical protein
MVLLYLVFYLVASSYQSPELLLHWRGPLRAKRGSSLFF